jgi:hypothetical protein
MKRAMKKIITAISALLTLQGAGIFAQTTQNFNYTGSFQTFTIPSCVTSITVDVKGAAGGNGVNPSAQVMSNGGLGGRVQGTISVNPGDVLYIYVGGAGSDGVNNGGPGGFNGGGQGGWRTDGYRGGGGGGASDIRLNGTGLNNRIFVAGGGGGAGDNYFTFNYDKGGNGGGLTGQDGLGGNNPLQEGAGAGGTQSAGGTGGTYPSYCTSGSGSFGLGGNACGGSGGSSNGNSGGGGGGGGWYGGGAGDWGGAGGGSGYNSPSATGVTYTSGFQSGNGVVSITYSPGIPSAAGPITGPANICANSTANYSISTVSGATSYSWAVPSGAVINSGQGTTSINVTFGSSSGTISVTPSNSCGSSAAANLSVTVNAAPVVTLGPNQTQCGGSVSLNAGNPGSTYLWSNAATTQSISVSSSGTYSVVVTNASGCTGTGSVVVTINTPPTVNLGTDVTQCGGTVNLNAGNAASYAWSNSATTSSITVSASGTYSVVITDANGCTGSDAINVTINTPPVVNLGTDIIQCGGPVSLDAQNAGSIYAWSESSTTQTISVSASGTYSVLVTDANGCTGSDAINVTINTPPVVSLGADITQCGGTASLDAQNAGSAYAWSEGSTTQTISVSSSGNYAVLVTDANGCTGSDTVTVTINILPTVTLNMPATTACINWPAYALSGGAPSGGTYSGPGVSGGNFDPAAAGQGTWTITYDYTDTNGCQGSATQNITVDLCTGMNNITETGDVTAFPNPARDLLNLKFGSASASMHIELLDAQGKLVYEITEKNIKAGESRQLDLSAFGNGIYFLKMTGDKEVTLKRVELSK